MVISAIIISIIVVSVIIIVVIIVTKKKSNSNNSNESTDETSDDISHGLPDVLTKFNLLTFFYFDPVSEISYNEKKLFDTFW